MTMPTTVDVKHLSNAAEELAWQYLLASSQISTTPCTWKLGRHHIHEGGVQSAVKKAWLGGCPRIAPVARMARIFRLIYRDRTIESTQEPRQRRGNCYEGQALLRQPPGIIAPGARTQTSQWTDHPER